jgi:Protein of unknown function, DUF547
MTADLHGKQWEKYNRSLMFSAVTMFVVTAALCWSVIGMGIASAEESGFSYGRYAQTLKAFVNDKGMVNYAGLKGRRSHLDAFSGEIGKLGKASYDKWSDQQIIAFLINAYNALTLVAIIDNYPIKSSFFRSLKFPKNSIRQIAGVWDKLTFPFIGGKITLDGIEHDLLRKKFDEPRIHMALVCAAMGCPILRSEPFESARLNEQLDDQTKRFLKDPSKFRIDRKASKVYLSSILKWFGSDFVKKYGGTDKFGGYGDDERAVLNFVSGYLDPQDSEYLAKGGYSISYLDYDWSLNEQRK